MLQPLSREPGMGGGQWGTAAEAKFGWAYIMGVKMLGLMLTQYLTFGLRCQTVF